MPRVLVVDENSMVCKTIEACHERRGFGVTVAGGGITDIGERNSTFPKRAPAIPRAGVCGDAFAGVDPPSPDFPPLPLKLGVTACLRRPLTPNRLPATVNECLEQPFAVACPSN